MARKARQTTSVSTLVQQVNNLIIVANTAGRKDLLKVFADLHTRVSLFAAEYVELRAEIDPFVKALLSVQSVDDILEGIEQEETEEQEA
jgi:hypothetical protein